MIVDEKGEFYLDYEEIVALWPQGHTLFEKKPYPVSHLSEMIEEKKCCLCCLSPTLDGNKLCSTTCRNIWNNAKKRQTIELDNMRLSLEVVLGVMAVARKLAISNIHAFNLVMAKGVEVLRRQLTP